VTKKPRRTIINLPCDPDQDVQATPSRAYEGDKQTICNYYVEFSPSKLFCPSLLRGLVANTSPIITAGEFDTLLLLDIHSIRHFIQVYQLEVHGPCI